MAQPVMDRPQPVLGRDVSGSVQAQPIERKTTRIERVHAIINPASGSVEPGAAEHMATLFSEFGLQHSVSELAPGQFQATVQAALEGDPDLVVVLAGDGTSRFVGELCGPDGPLVVPLPGGTMNKLGRALYGPKPWRETLYEVLALGEEQCVPGGLVAGRAFFCSAVIGSPAFGARAREAFRAGDYGGTWSHAASAFQRAFQSRPRFELDSGETGRGMVVGLICPTISRAIAGEDALEAAVLDVRSVRAGMRLALHHLFGDWRDDPGVTTRPCVSGRIWARHSIPAMLDGEYFRFGREVEIGYRRRGFRTLAPAPHQEEPAS